MRFVVELSPAARRRLATTPFSFRKASRNLAQRELVMPFGGTGYVALHQIVSMSKVLVLAARHEREEDYHRRAGPNCNRRNWLSIKDNAVFRSQ